MTSSNEYDNPEPVPAASQLALLPFLAAIEGYLCEDGDVPGLRITIHRTMSREGHSYLQQACAYTGPGGTDSRGKVGRIFAVDTGIIGAAYGTKQIWRTKKFATLDQLESALREETLDPVKIARSWLAMPFLNLSEQVVLVLFADCNSLNFFADDERIRRIVAMSRGFCSLFDRLQRNPFENLRNFPLDSGEPVIGVGGLYKIQEPITSLTPPRFNVVASFNYDAGLT